MSTCDILDEISLAWFTNTAIASGRIYWVNRAVGATGPPSSCLWLLLRSHGISRGRRVAGSNWPTRSFSIATRPTGGASALEQPGTLVDDIRTGLRTCDRPARHTACSEQSIERPGCKGIRLTMARAATNHVVRVPMVPRPRLQTLSWRPDKSLNVVEQAGCLCDIGNEEQELLKFPQRLNAFFILESQKNLLIRSRSQPDSFATAFRYLQRAPTRVARVDPARDITELLERSDCLRGSLPRDMEGTSKRGRVDGTAIDRLHRGVVGGCCSWMAA